VVTREKKSAPPLPLLTKHHAELMHFTDLIARIAYSSNQGISNTGEENNQQNMRLMVLSQTKSSHPGFFP